MAGKVFISCGQRPPDETVIAYRIRDLLKDRFGLESYLAFKVQSFDDLMQITKELSICDYYLFIDFRRERLGWKGASYRGSLFTHQELAIARHLGFSEIIALQQEGVLLEGFAKYILSNPERFKSNEDLMNKIERLVRERGWSVTYSRNLVAGRLTRNVPMLYADHSTIRPRNEVIWHCQIANRRNDKAAINTLAILKQLENPDASISSPDNTFLKWAFQQNDYSRTIFPLSDASFDLLAVDFSAPRNVYLHSRLDTYLPTSVGTIERQPFIANGNGIYKLTYHVFAENFPILEFRIILNLTGDINTTELHYEQNNDRIRS